MKKATQNYPVRCPICQKKYTIELGTVVTSWKPFSVRFTQVDHPLSYTGYYALEFLDKMCLNCQGKGA